MNDQSHTSEISPELEARIVALVLGEASDLERDQLQRLIAERPELAALKAQFDSVHGLLRELATGEPTEPQISSGIDSKANDNWKLPAEARSALLAVIGGQAHQPPSLPVVHRPAAASQFIQQASRWRLSKIAAVLCLAGCVGMLALAGTFFIRTSRTFDASQLASKAKADSGFTDGLEMSLRQNSRPRLSGGTDAYFDLSATTPATNAGTDDAQNATSSLLAIRESLGTEPTRPSPYYLNDAIQYFRNSPPDKTLSSRADAVPLEPTADAAEATIETDREEDALAIAGDFAADGEAKPRLESRGVGDEASKLETRFGSALAREERSLERARQAGVELNFAEGLALSPQARPMSAGNSGGKANQSVEDLPALGYSLAGNEPTSVPSPILNPQPSPTDSKELEDLRGLNSDNNSRSNGSEVVRGWNEFDFSHFNGINGGDSQLQGAAKKDALGDLQAGQADPAQIGIAGVTLGRPVEPLIEGRASLQKEELQQEFSHPSSIPETNTRDEAVSTFSLHVSDVSFQLARAALAQGKWPEAAKVRIEEFVNAFDYGDPLPTAHEKVACRMEQAIHPFLQQRNVLRISLRTAAAGRASNTPLRLTLLLDNSGSMERSDRQQTVRRAFGLLAEQLTDSDQVTLISFARQPRLLADKVSGDKSPQLVKLIEQLPSEGGTNIEAALQLALEKAREQQIEGAQNRIILLTDGAVNLGDADPDNLSQMIASIRGEGIAFDAAGISADGLNDEILEALTRQGDGRYYLLDSLEAADDGFARQIAGALRPSAKNVKVQIEFNPQRVGRYRLLGFEKHLLQPEDFRNDSVDAAELAAAEAGVAVYQFEAKPDGEGDVGSVSVRFRDLSTGLMVENRWPIPYLANAPRLEQAAPALRVATSAALLAAKLRGESLGETVELKTLSKVILGLPDRLRNANRVQQLQMMIEQTQQLTAAGR